MEAGAADRAGGAAGSSGRCCRSSARRRRVALRHAGGSIIDLVGTNPPPLTSSTFARVLRPGEIEIRVTNPQREAITIGSVTVADAIVPYTVDGPATLERLRSATIVVPTTGSRTSPSPSA